MSKDRSADTDYADDTDCADRFRVPPMLRAAIAADVSSVRPLAAPLVRAAAVLPLAVVLLVAAPLTFEMRDVAALGPFWSWGASIFQATLGLALSIAALREAVPGRTWSSWSLALWVLAPMITVTLVTFVSWDRSPVPLSGARLLVGAICLLCAGVSALPATLLTAVLAARAWPVRAGVAGWLAGLGGGLMADAGWRLFCHFSEPSHVLGAHLAGVMVAGALGAWVTPRLVR
jgi:hypothetical protein